MLVISILILLVLLAAVTRAAVIAIERAAPPQGYFVAVRGARLHVVDLGLRDLAEPPIVMVHGASANLQSMRQPLGETLAREHRVLLFDRPGHGWSAREKLADSTPQAQAEMIAEALDSLGIARVVMVGHSWGGALVTAFALQHPGRVAGLVMLAPVTHPWSSGVAWYHNLAVLPGLGALFAHTLELPIARLMLLPGARGVFVPQAMPDGYAKTTALPLLIRPREFLTNGRDMVTLKASIDLLQPRYREITAPTVIIHGDADRTVSIAIHARAFAREVEGVRLIELTGVGHMVQNAAPEVVIDAIKSVISQSAGTLAAAASGN
jgi:pimeloyl-ACP methyl ester carboxylesterase